MNLRAEEASQHQLQLVEREDINDEEDLFEAIDKCKLLRFLDFCLFFFSRLLIRRFCSVLRLSCTDSDLKFEFEFGRFLFISFKFGFSACSRNDLRFELVSVSALVSLGLRSLTLDLSLISYISTLMLDLSLFL